MSQIWEYGEPDPPVSYDQPVVFVVWKETGDYYDTHEIVGFHRTFAAARERIEDVEEQSRWLYSINVEPLGD